MGLVYLRRSRLARSWPENLILMLLAFFLVFMALEFYFKVFFAQTDDFDTLARHNWRERYYNDTFNSLGYRDREWTPELVEGKIKVMVVGDSFVEGAGIEDPVDRFSDQLAEKLGPDYVVFNLGRRGAYTSQEIYAVLHYPYQPDILIWAYVLNDIEEVAVKHGFAIPPKPEIPPSLRPLIENSYAFNFLFWRLTHLMAVWQPDTKWQWLLSIYNDPEAWRFHEQELLSIYHEAQTRRLPLLVVVFPGMTNIEASRVITERIIDLYHSKGVPTLDVADLIATTPTSELVASPVDAHPSERVHHLVAAALYQMFVELKLAK